MSDRPAVSIPEFAAVEQSVISTHPSAVRSAVCTAFASTHNSTYACPIFATLQPTVATANITAIILAVRSAYWKALYAALTTTITATCESAYWSAFGGSDLAAEQWTVEVSFSSANGQSLVTPILPPQYTAHEYAIKPTVEPPQWPT